MKLQMYSIKDKAIGFQKPIFAQNDAVILREFKNAVIAKEPNEINTNAEDKELWKIGAFDDSTAQLETDTKLLATALQYKLEKEELERNGN